MGFSRGLEGPLRWLRRLRPAPAIGLAATLAALAVAGVATHSLLEPHSPPAGRASPAALRLADANGVLDSDRDGLSDARENYIYGTNPFRPSTAGGAIPDGWLVRHGLDPLDPGIASRPAAVPPPEALPPAYRGVWPDADTPTLLEVYSHGMPAQWNVSAQGPYDSGLDPRRWDSNGDGIPDGWLLRYGLDPRAKDLAGQSLAGPGGLSVREAFEHRTDPTKLDTDGDGLADREELAGPRDPLSPTARFAPTDPARYDSNGAGVCDGYLAAHGLDPSDPRSAYGDQDRDGATTAEEFVWGQSRFGEACADGKGLDPRSMFSGGLAIPDGWLVRYGLDAFDPATLSRVTEHAAHEPGPRIQEAPDGRVTVPDDLALTVWDEYALGRPANWTEARDGPWWGGTSPASNDTDGDGLGDAWEIRGYIVRASSDPLNPQPTFNVTRSDPTKADTDDDGLGDGVEADKARNGGFVMDAQRRDTDFDGILDGAEFAFIPDGLDPTRADSTATLADDGTVQVPGDHLLDGERLALLQARAALYAQEGILYTYGASSPRTQECGAPADGVACSKTAVAAFAGMKGELSLAALPGNLTAAELAARVGPHGRLYGPCTAPNDLRCRANVANRDIDADGLDNGVELHPGLYPRSAKSDTAYGRSCASVACPPSDPLQVDSDGDGLWDGWEVDHGGPAGAVPALNPSRWDSGSGHCKDNPRDAANRCSDADKDPDQDSITWFTYGPQSRSDHRFTFENLREQQAGTDPNHGSSHGDGLGDGWKVFWGGDYNGKLPWCREWQCYPDRADRGSVFPRQDPQDPSSPFNLLAILTSPHRPHFDGAQPASQPDAVLATAAYRRTVLAKDSTGAPLDPDAQLHETPLTLNDDWKSPLAVSRQGSDDSWVVQVAGTVRFTLQDAQRLNTNPYMAADPLSSDGDGMPDWWEGLFGQPLKGMGSGPDGAAHCKDDARLDPANPDGADDADDDKLPNLLEYTHDTFPGVTGTSPDLAARLLGPPVLPFGWAGGNPLCSDSDMGSLMDSSETLLSGFQLGNPFDDTNGLVTQDSDGDGLADKEELTATVPTDPFSPDTDGDGLLDGPDMGPAYPANGPNTTYRGHRFSLQDPVLGKLTRLWLDLGLVYKRELVDGGAFAYRFLGERGPSAGTNPTDPDEADAGVPQGWLVAHRLSPLESYDRSCQKYYEKGQPSWWKGMERRFGPWWGGIVGARPLDGLAAPCGTLPRHTLTDDDSDGLHELDRNGEPFEDPAPANHGNRFAAVNGARYGWPGPAINAGEPVDPSDARFSDPTNLQFNATVQRLAAQAFFSPHVYGMEHEGKTYGERYPELDPTLSPPARETPCIRLETGRFDDGSLTLAKGVERTLRGSVFLPDCKTPAANVTVEARMGPGTNLQLFGAAFTSATGAFVLPVNISAVEHSATVPAGAVLRGASAGTVTWRADASVVATGQPPDSQRTLHVATYATSALRGCDLLSDCAERQSPPQSCTPQHLNLYCLTVTATPRIDVLQPTADGVPAGQDLAVNLFLGDSGGTPSPGRLVQVRLGNLRPPADPITGPDGLAGVVLHVPSDFALGPTSLSIESSENPEKPDGFGRIAKSVPLAVRATPAVTVDLPATADAGAKLEVAGAATVRGKGVGANVPVTVGVLGAGVEATVPSNDDGSFRVRLALPQGLSAGRYTVLVAPAQGPMNLPGQGSGSLFVRSLAHWVVDDADTGPIRLGVPAAVHARLVKADGTGLGGVPVDVEVEGLRATTHTSASGTMDVVLPGSLPPRPVLQTLTFAGNATHAPARLQVQRAVSTPSLLAVPDGVVARGGDAYVLARLADADRRPIAGVPVLVVWGSEANHTLLTDARGEAVLARPGSPADPLGTVTVRASYAGSPDGTRGAAQATGAWTVRTLSEILLPHGNATAGEPVPPGLLRDAGTRRPVAGAHVTLRLQAVGGPAAWSNVTTDGQGLFAVLATPLAGSDPRLLHIEAVAKALQEYPSARAEADLAIRSATTLDPQAPQVLVLGREAVVPVKATDARRLPVAAGEVQAFLDNRLVGSAHLQDGAARVRITPPTNLSAGPATLRLFFPGTSTHAPNETSVQVRLAAPATLTLQIQPARPGGTARVEVAATAADGTPLAFTRLTLEVQGQPSGLSAQTDKDGKAVFLLPQANQTRLVAAVLEGGPAIGPASASTILAPVQPPSALRSGLAIGAWLVAAAAALAACGALAAWRLRRRDLAAAFERVRAILAASGPLEAQVLQAYRALEDEAIAHEILDAPAQTPRLLEEALAPALPRALRPNLDLLISLFEATRYGRASMRPLERDAALAALDNLVRNLRRGGVAAWWTGRTGGAA